MQGVRTHAAPAALVPATLVAEDAELLLKLAPRLVFDLPACGGCRDLAAAYLAVAHDRPFSRELAQEYARCILTHHPDYQPRDCDRYAAAALRGDAMTLADHLYSVVCQMHSAERSLAEGSWCRDVRGEPPSSIRFDLVGDFLHAEDLDAAGVICRDDVAQADESQSSGPLFAECPAMGWEGMLFAEHGVAPRYVGGHRGGEAFVSVCMRLPQCARCWGLFHRAVDLAFERCENVERAERARAYAKIILDAHPDYVPEGRDPRHGADSRDRCFYDYALDKLCWLTHAEFFYAHLCRLSLLRERLPQDAWERDLTADGDVEPNPGPPFACSWAEQVELSKAARPARSSWPAPRLPSAAVLIGLIAVLLVAHTTWEATRGGADAHVVRIARAWAVNVAISLAAHVASGGALRPAIVLRTARTSAAETALIYWLGRVACGAGGWIRNLCVDGDVEANPGPRVGIRSAAFLSVVGCAAAATFMLLRRPRERHRLAVPLSAIAVPALRYHVIGDEMHVEDETRPELGWLPVAPEQAARHLAGLSATSETLAALRAIAAYNLGLATARYLPTVGGESLGLLGLPTLFVQLFRAGVASDASYALATRHAGCDELYVECFTTITFERGAFCYAREVDEHPTVTVRRNATKQAQNATLSLRRGDEEVFVTFAIDSALIVEHDGHKAEVVRMAASTTNNVVMPHNVRNINGKDDEVGAATMLPLARDGSAVPFAGLVHPRAVTAAFTRRFDGATRRGFGLFIKAVAHAEPAPRISAASAARAALEATPLETRDDTAQPNDAQFVANARALTGDGDAPVADCSDDQSSSGDTYASVASTDTPRIIRTRVAARVDGSAHRADGRPRAAVEFRWNADALDAELARDLCAKFGRNLTLVSDISVLRNAPRNGRHDPPVEIHFQTTRNGAPKRRARVPVRVDPAAGVGLPAAAPSPPPPAPPMPPKLPERKPRVEHGSELVPDSPPIMRDGVPQPQTIVASSSTLVYIEGELEGGNMQAFIPPLNGKPIFGPSRVGSVESVDKRAAVLAADVPAFEGYEQDCITVMSLVFEAATQESCGQSSPFALDDAEDVLSAFDTPAKFLNYLAGMGAFGEDLMAQKNADSFLKREPVKFKKTGAKPRIITSTPNAQAIGATYTHALTRIVKRLGYCPLGLGWRDLHEFIGAAFVPGCRVLSSDLSGCDGHVSALVRRLERAIERMLTRGQADIVSKLYDLRSHTRDGLRYFTGFGRCSGSPDTTIGNTLMILAIFATYRRLLGLSATAEDVHAGLRACGDDAIIIVADASAAERHADAWVAACALWGHEAELDAHDEGRGFDPSRHSVNFLGRKFYLTDSQCRSFAPAGRLYDKFGAYATNQDAEAAARDITFCRLLTDPNTFLIADICRAIRKVGASARDNRNVSMWKTQVVADEHMPFLARGESGPEDFADLDGGVHQLTVDEFFATYPDADVSLIFEHIAAADGWAGTLAEYLAAFPPFLRQDHAISGNCIVDGRVYGAVMEVTAKTASRMFTKPPAVKRQAAPQTYTGATQRRAKTYGGASRRRADRAAADSSVDC